MAGREEDQKAGLHVGSNADLGLALGVEAPVMKPNGVIFHFFSQMLKAKQRAYMAGENTGRLDILFVHGIQYDLGSKQLQV